MNYECLATIKIRRIDYSHFSNNKVKVKARHAKF